MFLTICVKLKKPFKKTAAEIVIGDSNYDGMDGLFGLETLSFLPNIFKEMAKKEPQDPYHEYSKPFSRSRVGTGAFGGSSALPLIKDLKTTRQIRTNRDYFLELLNSMPFVSYGRYPYRLKTYHPANMKAKKTGNLISKGKTAVGGGGNTTFTLNAFLNLHPYFTSLTRGEDIVQMLLMIGVYGEKVQRIDNNAPVIHRRLAGNRMNLKKEIEAFYQSFIVVGILNWLISNVIDNENGDKPFSSGKIILESPHASQLTREKIRDMMKLADQVPSEIILSIEKEVYALVTEQFEMANKSISEMFSQGYFDTENNDFWWKNDPEIKETLGAIRNVFSSLSSNRYLNEIEGIHLQFQNGDFPTFIQKAKDDLLRYGDNLDKWYEKMDKPVMGISEKEDIEEPYLRIEDKEWVALIPQLPSQLLENIRIPGEKASTNRIKQYFKSRKIDTLKNNLIILTSGIVELVSKKGDSRVHLHPGDLISSGQIEQLKKGNLIIEASDDAEWLYLPNNAYRSFIAEKNVVKCISILQRRVYALQKWLQKTTFGGLKDISLRGLKHLAVKSTERSFNQGESIIKEGETGKDFYIIFSGKVHIEKKEEGTVAELSEGGYFGEMALMGKTTRSASVIADSDLHVITFDDRLFGYLLEEFPLVKKTIETVSSRRSVPDSIFSSFGLVETIPSSIGFIKDPRNFPKLGFTFLSKTGGVLWLAGKAILINPDQKVVQAIENLNLDETIISGYLFTSNLTEDNIDSFLEYSSQYRQKPVFLIGEANLLHGNFTENRIYVTKLLSNTKNKIRIAEGITSILSIDPDKDNLSVTYLDKDLVVPINPAYKNDEIGSTSIVLRSDANQWEEFISQVCHIVSIVQNLQSEIPKSAIARGKIHFCQSGEHILEKGNYVSAETPGKRNITDILNTEERYHIIISGNAEVVSGDKTIILGPGGDVGSWSLEQDERPSATVKAGANGVWLLSLTGKEYHEIISTPKTREAIKNTLKNLTFFQELAKHHGWIMNLPELAKASLASRAQSRVYRPGQNIIAEGEKTRDVYFVKNGLVKVTTRTKGGEITEIGDFSEGFLFGEMGAITGAPRTATITAVNPTEVISIDEKTFLEFLYGYPLAADALDRIVDARNAKLLQARVNIFDHNANLISKIEDIKIVLKALFVEYPSGIESEKYLADLLKTLRDKILVGKYNLDMLEVGKILGDILINIDRKELEDKDNHILRNVLELLLKINPHKISSTIGYCKNPDKLKETLKHLFLLINDDRLSNVSLLGLKGGNIIGGLEPTQYSELMNLLSEDFTVVEGSVNKEPREHFFRRWGERFYSYICQTSYKSSNKKQAEYV